ncbi:hypothetical protein NQ315_002136 [Exocentrus adspersus]|uniref:Serpin domain-containing protein n=1 Tax=Exocentrus adspersus TaxID=1586481 RepID=A0AAV8VZL9_9CUCU|nr:hypothetical protein NQ315_002136 [Exocentrus adspersus]
MFPVLVLAILPWCTLAQNGETLFFPDEQGGLINTDNSIKLPPNLNLTEIRGTTIYENFVDKIIAGGISKLTLAINKALLHQTSSDKENVVFAPVSISGALALILLGSNGGTFEEITSVLGLATGIDIKSKSLQVHEQFGRMIEKLERAPGPGQQINFAAAVFVQNNYPIRSIYEQTARDLYGSEVLNVDFRSNPGKAQEVINSWVIEKTNGKIRHILGEEPSPETRVIIASAMYFKALWEKPFFEGTTTRRPFYPDGRKSPTSIEVEMMANGGDFPYFKDHTLNCEVMGFPYEGNASIMYVVMPSGSNARKLRQLEESLTPSDLQGLADKTVYTRAVLLFPKMRIESTIDLKSSLELLGVKSLFVPSRANLALLSAGEGTNNAPVTQDRFSDAVDCSLNGTDATHNNTKEKLVKELDGKVGRRIVISSRTSETIDNLRRLINQQSTDNSYQNPGLYADKVIHKVYMDITETGTEAAASTSVSLSRDGGRVTFRVDVPFFFFIRHEETKTLLFWGSGLDKVVVSGIDIPINAGMLLLVAFLLTCVAYLWANYYKTLCYWKSKGIKYVTPFPIFGNSLPTLLQSVTYSEYVVDLYKKFPEERYCGTFQYSQPILLLRDLKLIKRVFTREFETFSDHPLPSEPDEGTLWGKNLFAANGDRWKHLRQTISPAFTSTKLKSMFELMDVCALQLIEYLNEQNRDVVEVELRDIFKRFSSDVITSIAFGAETNSFKDKNNDFMKMGAELTNFGGMQKLKRLLYTANPKITRLLNIKMHPDNVSTFFRKLVKDSIKQREENKASGRPDYIQYLLECRRGQEPTTSVGGVGEEEFSVTEEASFCVGNRKFALELTDDDITAQALDFFYGGFYSTASFMYFCVYELAINWEIQDKLRSEVDAALEASGGSITYDVLSRMKYLDMVISETLRKWPTATWIDRKSNKPIVIEPENTKETPLDLESGTFLRFIETPNTGPIPKKFDPERFGDGNRSQICSFSFLPFGAGPRSCVGSRFAIMEAKLIIVRLVSLYEVIPTEKSIVAKNPYLTSANSFWFGFKKRCP